MNFIQTPALIAGSIFGVIIVISLIRCCVRYQRSANPTDTKPPTVSYNPPVPVVPYPLPSYHPPVDNQTSHQQSENYSISNTVPHNGQQQQQIFPVLLQQQPWMYQPTPANNDQEPPSVSNTVQQPWMHQPTPANNDQASVSNTVPLFNPHPISVPSEPPQTYVPPTPPQPPALLDGGPPSRPNESDAMDKRKFIDELNSFHVAGESRNSSCPVCMEPLGDQPVSTGNCLHLAHTSCLKQWLVRDAEFTCPVCRVPLIDT